MSDGFEEAKSQRNWLERLGELIPGFSGFQNRELRRDVDKMQREHLAKELIQLKAVVRSKAQALTDEGQIGNLHLFDRLDRRIDGLSQSIRFSDYGATGFFDVEKIGQSELESLYEFDLSLLTEISDLGGELAAIPLPSQGDAAAAAQQALTRLGTIEDRWAGRQNVINDIVKTAS